MCIIYILLKKIVFSFYQIAKYNISSCRDLYNHVVSFKDILKVENVYHRNMAKQFSLVEMMAKCLFDMPSSVEDNIV